MNSMWLWTICCWILITYSRRKKIVVSFAGAHTSSANDGQAKKNKDQNKICVARVKLLIGREKRKTNFYVQNSVWIGYHPCLKVLWVDIFLGGMIDMDWICQIVNWSTIQVYLYLFNCKIHGQFARSKCCSNIASFANAFQNFWHFKKITQFHTGALNDFFIYFKEENYGLYLSNCPLCQQIVHSVCFDIVGLNLLLV